MEHIKIDLLSPLEKGYIKTDIHNMFQDEQLRRRIVLRKNTGESFDPATSVKTITWTNTETYAMKGIYPSREASSGKGLGMILQLGDFPYLIPLKDITSDPLDKDDRILEFRYSEGLVNVTKNSKSVVGLGTELSTYAGKGDWFKLRYEPLSYLKEVASTPTADLVMALVNNYTGETKTSQPYDIFKEYMVVGVDKDTFTGIIIMYWCREVK